jgi:hypothetical protein
MPKAKLSWHEKLKRAKALQDMWEEMINKRSQMLFSSFGEELATVVGDKYKKKKEELGEDLEFLEWCLAVRENLRLHGEELQSAKEYILGEMEELEGDIAKCSPVAEEWRALQKQRFWGRVLWLITGRVE